MPYFKCHDNWNGFWHGNFIVIRAPDHILHHWGNVLIFHGQDNFKLPLYPWRSWIPGSVYLWWSHETMRSEPGKKSAGSPSESHQHMGTANGGQGSPPPYCDQAHGLTPRESTIKKLLSLSEYYFVIMIRALFLLKSSLLGRSTMWLHIPQI